MFTCKVPTANDIHGLIAIEHRLFEGISLSERRILEVHEFCPEFFCVLRDDNANIVGYSSVFTMKPEEASRFIAGELSEPDLAPDLLLTPSDANFCTTHAYVGSVVIDGDFNILTRSALLASLLSWRMTQMTRLALRRLPVFMMSASEQGSQLVRFIGARTIADGAERGDGMAIYGRTITPGFLNRANKALRRCLSSGFVKMDFANCHER